MALFQLRVPFFTPADDEIEHRLPARQSSMFSCISVGSVVRFVRAS